MLIKTINLSELDNQPIEIREAVAFYTAHSILPIHFTAKDRDRHYNVLEQAGYIEPISAVI